jgi:signal transduction histidine kinase
MSLRTAVIIVGTLLLVLFGVLSFWLDKTTHLLEFEARELSEAHESVRVAQELKIRLLVHNRGSFLNQLGADGAQDRTSQVERAEIQQYLASTREYLNSADEAALLEEVTNEINSYLKRRDSLENSQLPSRDKYLAVSRDLDKAFSSIDRFIALNRAQASAFADEIARQNAAATVLARASFVGGGLLLALIIAGSFWLLARPLIGIGTVIGSYSAGDTAARIRVRGLREIQSIGSMFNSMADSLEQRRQDRLRFIASIAHDLRNPLHSIMMMSEVLNRKARAEDREPARIIFREMQNLDRLVGDLLDTTRIEAGQLILHYSVHDVRSMVWDAVELQRTGATIHQFEVELPDKPLTCRCDSARFSQMMNNLLSNAVKYSPNGGTIRVTARHDGDRVEVDVCDEGIGIEPGELDNIFVPFKRAEATKRTIPGVGLGLSTSRRIAEAHGGELSVRSVPGRGSTFTISIPAAVIQDAIFTT